MAERRTRLGARTDVARRQRGRATIDRLLDASLAIVEQEGLEGLTTTAVTRASGVSVGSLYHHFGSFEGLAAELYARSMAALLDALVAELERSRTARTGVLRFVEGYLRWGVEHPVEARVIHGSAFAGFLAANAAAVDEAKGPRMARMLAWIEPFMARGDVVRLSPPMLEALLVGPPAEATRRWLAGAAGYDLDDARRALPERVWRSVSRE
ncbi:TetR/AcrR family transcriptional regulator [Patulibacter defluvii]|uniref:TetR/AcrR family transcriptional regulator n=1 Tax=Patulibacter defluvii TaxID=3095358 RepID=UPI002A74BE40|nr:TetR/AcrR family transcriptional regulator [Patulibacter sp. DM4]